MSVLHTTSEAPPVPETRELLAALLAAYSRGEPGSPPGSVAIVGNAPVDPDPGRAAAVDGADLVIRMTSFAVDTDDRAPALGRRTDVVMLHRGLVASPHTFTDYTSRLYLLVEPGRLHWEPETLPDWWPADLGFLPVPNREFTLPLNRLLGFPATAATWSTTGTLTAYLVTELFPDARVLMTGMSIIDQPEQTSFAHAWGAAVDVTAEHRLAAEASLLRRWVHDGRIEVIP
ncbi:hypothetical protein V5P93_000175 [Actinokineospora auranticolor]|uniref:Glycosyl transferase family 29 (Putative sialyltransferase) n=1 Tax=Actinokineospora auranticolor TaxID=155976 RepID=A0A2S6GLA4_9PSEU|nr:hypothetical protein [Actinokineospora auranticolor]PPK65931.1 hypothetical protein CLV40_112199 [Actinokineospora auranticolor]